MATTVTMPPNNSIALAAKYLPILDEVYKRASLTSMFDTARAEFVGANTVKLYNFDSVGIRFPANKIAQDFIKVAGVPIAASSANISGKPAPATAREVFENLSGRVEIILDGGACEVGVSSTVIDMTAAPRILRQGTISAAAIDKILSGRTD